MSLVWPVNLIAKDIPSEPGTTGRLVSTKQDANGFNHSSLGILWAD